MLVLILNPKVFLGKFGPKNWNSPNWLKFDKGVHCFILISNLKFIFKNFCHTFFWANLVQKSDFPQINWNLIQEYIVICLLRLKCLVLQKILSVIFFRTNLISKFEVLQTDWNLVQGYITICLFTILMFVIHTTLAKLGLEIWCCPLFVIINNIICRLQSKDIMSKFCSI